MKKLMSFAVCAIFAFSSMLAPAQTDKKAEPKKTEAKQETSTPSTSGQKLKKDGTPDMRYKDNKEAVKPAGPTKKDGTPDMRHKANKAAAAQKK